MKKTTKNPITEKITPEAGQEDETVRGSGFTYDEAKHRTDESIPVELSKDKEQAVVLPDLGKPNRP
jgi:hypothetical protein